MIQKDYYRILGISNDASVAQIKKAYRSLAMQYHPDRNPGDEAEASLKFKAINEAFCVLTDPDRKRIYDRLGTADITAEFSRGPYTGASAVGSMADQRRADPRFDFLNRMFHGTGGDPGCRFESCGGADNAEPQDLRHQLTLDAQDLRRGGAEMEINGRQLWFKIPPGLQTGNTIRLRDARQVIDGVPGDIVVTVTLA